MVEVVQDLFDYVTYAGGVGRRRVDSVRGFGAGTPRPGAADFAIIKEDPTEPHGPQIKCMKDLMFHEMLDRPFEEKAYPAQLEEFAYRGERIVRQVEHRFGEVQRMIDHDVLRRSRALPGLLRGMNDELHRAHGLITGELEDVWHMRFEPFFYPSDHTDGDDQSDDSSDGDGEDDGEGSKGRLRNFGKGLPGGWLDLSDIILTARLLIRYIAELVSLVAMAVNQLPLDALGPRAQLRATLPHPALRAIVAAFAARVPWIGALLKPDEECAALAHQPPVSATSMLNDAIATLDDVLTVHMKKLLSDLHRTMYQAFVRMCASYARWKRTFKEERKKALEAEAAARANLRRERRSSMHHSKVTPLSPKSHRGRRGSAGHSSASSGASFFVESLQAACAQETPSGSGGLVEIREDPQDGGSEKEPGPAVAMDEMD